MKKITALILSVIMSLSLISAPTFAATKGEKCRCSGDPDDSSKWTGEVTVDTSILSACECKNDKGEVTTSAIENILNLVVQIMSIGVGILGVVGITIVGIQYLTAGGSEEKTRKAKRRLIEILIGLAVYAVMAALLSWLLPTFTPKPADTNNSGSSENGGGGGSGSGNRTRPSNPNPGRYNIEN